MFTAIGFLRPLVRVGCVGVLCLLLNGCGATEAVSDVFTTITKADIVVQASNNVNPDINGRPSPILIRIYQLKSSVAFNNADFFALYDRDVAELGADYVARDDLDLKPGESKPLERRFSDDTRYLGIIAAYRNIDSTVWKKVIEIEPDSNSEILVLLNDKGVQITRQ